MQSYIFSTILMNFELPDITNALELDNTLSFHVKSEIRDKDTGSITILTSIFRYQPLHVQFKEEQKIM